MSHGADHPSSNSSTLSFRVPPAQKMHPRRLAMAHIAATKRTKQKRRSAPKSARLSPSEMKMELMSRDPLWRELVKIFEASEEPEDDWKPGGRVDQLRQTLERKYQLPCRTVSPRHVGKSPELIILDEDSPKAKADWWIPGFSIPPIRTTIAHFEGLLIQRIRPSPHCEKSETPRFLVEVDLGRVGAWDLSYLVDEFRERLRAALKNFKKGWKEIPELGAFRYVNTEIFHSDLRRYDLHITHGLSFRLIGLVESLERQGKDVPKRQRRVGHKVPAESSVGGSVHRIYRAIYRKRYNAKRRRLDHSAEGFEPYSCPNHGNRCGRNCQYMQDWWRRVQPTLPTDKTGMVWKVATLKETTLPIRPRGRRKKAKKPGNSFPAV